jgi:hypothetical protein
VREVQLRRVASRGAQRLGDPATDPRVVKRDGRGAEALPTCLGAYHEEAKAHEGQVDCQNANRVLAVRTDSHADQGPVGDKRRRSYILGDILRAQRLPHLGGGRPADGRNVMRACRRRRVVGAAWQEQTPEGRNPTSATCLKMAGRRREEEGR